MRLPEYDSLDAVEMASLIARRELTAAELLEAALERAGARNPAISAIVHRWDDEARARAQAPLAAGPLSGVPFLLKDLLTGWAGQPLESSSRLFRGLRSPADSEVGRRIRAGGLVPFGRTVSSEMGLLGTAEPAAHAPCRNPWDLSRTPGGSSGGSAAAVAARIVPIAGGGDGGGSLRIPASHCGLFGLKPSRGRVPTAPHGEHWYGLAQEHVVTRSVRDSAAFLDLTCGITSGEQPALPRPASPFLEELGHPPGRLRIAFTTGALFADGQHADCRAAVEDAARLLAGLGHEVEEAAPPFDRAALVKAFLVLVSASTSCDVARMAREAGRALDPSLLEPETRGVVLAGRHLRAAEVTGALEDVQRARRELATFFERYDLVLTATNGRPPVRIGELAMPLANRLGLALLWRLPIGPLLDRMIEEAAEAPLAATPNTQLWNLTGQPAMSVPLWWNSDGLPIGAQLAGRYGDEALLLRIAAQLEAARPWAQRAPPGVAAA